MAVNTFDSETKVGDSIYKVLPLHQVPELTNECCVLINMEWKRSHTARLRSVSSSCDNFPTNLVLLSESQRPRVIGHCKVSKFSPAIPAVFIESVVIHPKYRGRGLGKLLMIKTELYLKKKGISCVYLSTRGQEVFYEKLGYVKCPPVNVYGCPQNLSLEDENSNDENDLPNSNNRETSATIKSSQNLDFTSSNFPPPPLLPPPPPPLPPPLKKPLETGEKTDSTKIYMKKKIQIE